MTHCKLNLVFASFVLHIIIFEPNLVIFLIVEEVGPVGVSLHETKLKQLPQT